MFETTEKDSKYDALRSKTDKSEKAKKVLRGAGYARGGGVGRAKHPDAKEDKKLIKKEMRSAKIVPKKHGGKVSGEKPKSRPDKYARGGSAPRGHDNGHKGTKVNIMVGAGQAEKQQAMQTGMQLGAKMAAAKMQGAGGPPRPMGGAPMQARPMPAPPGAGGAPGGNPGGMPQGVPPTMANRGGRMNRGGKVGPKKVPGVTNISEGGAGGAKGRLEKIKKYGSKPKG